MRLRRTAWQDAAIAELTARAAATADLAQRWAAAEAATDARYSEMCSIQPEEERHLLAELIDTAERETRVT